MSEKAKIGMVLVIAVLVLVPVVGKMAQNNRDAARTGQGAYTLVSVDGHALPYSPYHEGQQSPRIIAGSIKLREGGAFVSSMSFSRPVGGPMIRQFEGTYVKEGDDYLLRWEGAGQTQVTIEGDTLTMNNEGNLFVYPK